MANFVLLHGGAMGAWVWRPVEKILRANGHSTFAITFTGFAERRHLCSKDVTPQTSVADVVNTLFYEDIEECVLVAHSYSGSVVPGVYQAAGERIRRMILVDSLVTRSGEAVAEALGFMTREQAMGVTAAIQRGEMPIYSGVADQQRKTLADEHPDMRADRRQWLFDHLGEMPTTCNTAPVLVGAETLPKDKVDYIACTKTVMEPMAKRARELGFAVHSFEGDHALLAGDPEGTAALVEKLGA